jgi:transposase InsO family protein
MRFIDEHRDRYAVALLLRVLDVTASTYYGWVQQAVQPCDRQDPRHTPAPDLVNRTFTAAGPDRLWVADATRIPCAEGVFWMAAVRDVFSNRIVGWKTSDRCDTDLILAALEYGVWSRDVRDQQLIHHSDRGSNGGFNWSSQHLEYGGVDGQAGGVDEGVDG